MAKTMRISAIMFVLSAASVHAGQAYQPEIPQVGPADKTFLELNRQLEGSKIKKSEKGEGTVPASLASICPICRKPLYRHAEDNFECIPIDPRTNEIRNILKIVTREAQCPVCKAKFSGALPGNVNDKGGLDRDYCAHSIGMSSVHSNVWVCPDCGYAALIDGFGKGLDGNPLDEETKAFVRQTLSAQMKERMIDVAGLTRRKDQPHLPEVLVFSNYVLQSEIPDWIKYENAIQIYEHAKPPHTLMALLYLDAAHACRREVCKEISAPGLNNASQESFGRSIRLINSYIRSEAFNIRRQRNEPVLDPNKMESDPWILAQAADNIIRFAAETGNRREVDPKNPDAETKMFTNIDLFVLNIRQAGFFDRLGRIKKADEILEKARGYILVQPQGAEISTNEAVEKQIAILRGIVDDRQACLRRESTYLFKAADKKMAALKFMEVGYRDYSKGFWVKEEQKKCDLATTTYLMGEVLRRADVPEAAAAWFDVADPIISKYLTILDEQEKKGPPLGVDVGPNEFDAERGRLLTLKTWAKEQRTLIKAPKPPDAHVSGIIALILEACKIDPLSITAAAAAKAEKLTPEQMQAKLRSLGFGAPTVQPVADVNGVKGATPAAKPGDVSVEIKTREQLYHLYFDALTRYRKDKKVNAPNLAELVKDGYLRAEDAHLDEDGKLHCPETSERIGYMKSWDPADETKPVLFPIRPGTKTLYSDGQVRVAR